MRPAAFKSSFLKTGIWSSAKTASMLRESGRVALALSNASVAENSASGTAVGTLSSTDPDAGNTFSYSLVTGTGSTDNGSFQIVGSALKTLAVFDYETKSSYSVRVRTTDQGGLSIEQVFTITRSAASTVEGSAPIPRSWPSTASESAWLTRQPKVTTEYALR